MNKTLSTILVVLAILVLAGGIFFAGTIYARSNMMFGWSNNSVYGPGMMGNGRGGYGMGSMMSGQRGYGMGPGMMGNYGWNNGTNSDVTPLTIDQARQAAETYIRSFDLNGLETGEVMIFDNNAYVIVKETETGVGAFELLVDPVSQIAYPEYGPNMMWNLKYGGLAHGSMMGGRGGFGMMGGMMSGTGMTLAPGASAGVNGWVYQTIPANVSAELTVTPEQAVEYAQKYLDQYQPGATVATDAAQFYGYYTFDFSKDGKIIGMLSVNGYNGQVFLHTWHGTFIEEAE